MEKERVEDSEIKFYPELYRYAYALVKDSDAAKDLIQETMLKALCK